MEWGLNIPPDQFLESHFTHRGLTGAVFWANSTKNGSFYLHADTYQAQNLIQTIRTTFEIRGESASVVLD